MAAAVTLPAITCPLCGQRLEVTTTTTREFDLLTVRVHVPPATADHLAAHRN